MNLFPFFTDISGKTFLIVGGGDVAREKVESISRFGEKIVIVACETDIEATDRIKVYKRAFKPEDINGVDYVIGATGDRALNEEIASLCDKAGIPVNIADDADLCTFVMPSMVKRGRFVAAFSTNGASPAFAMCMRRTVEDFVPEHIDDILARMEHVRGEAVRLIPEQPRRKRFFTELLTELIETDNALSDEEIRERIRTYER